MNDQDAREDRSSGTLERFASRAFADDVERIDAATRARLAGSRERAIDALSTRSVPLRWHAGPLRRAPGWAVAGAAAALVLALMLALRPGEQSPAGPLGSPLVAGDRGAADAPPVPARTAVDIEPIGATEALAWPSDLVLLAGEDPPVIDVLEDELEFYAWLENQPELALLGDER